MDDPFLVRVDSYDGTTTVRLRGDIDIAAGRVVRAAIADSVLDKTPPSRLVIDLTEATFLGSAGLNALVLARYAAGFVDAVLEVTSGPPNVMRVVELSELERFLNIRPRVTTTG